MSRMLILEVDAHHPDITKLIKIHKVYCQSNTPEGSGHAILDAQNETNDIKFWLAIENNESLG